jgi:hypothetical protein
MKGWLAKLQTHRSLLVALAACIALVIVLAVLSLLHTRTIARLGHKSVGSIGHLFWVTNCTEKGIITCPLVLEVKDGEVWRKDRSLSMGVDIVNPHGNAVEYISWPHGSAPRRVRFYVVTVMDGPEKWCRWTSTYVHKGYLSLVRRQPWPKFPPYESSKSVELVSEEIL